MITQELLLKAFHAYDDAPEPKPTVSAVARTHAVPYDMLRGALILHGMCPEPMRAGRGPSKRPKAEPGKRGRPKLPALEGQVGLLNYLLELHGSGAATAKALGVNIKTLLRWIGGDRMSESLFKTWTHKRATMVAEIQPKQ